MRLAMKLFSIAIIFLFLLVAAGYCVAAFDPAWLHQREQGRITVVNLDATTKEPIRDTVYTISIPGTSNIMQVMVTDENGKATSTLFDYGTAYELRQTNIMDPYQLNEKPVAVKINGQSEVIQAVNKMYTYVKKAKRTTDGQIEIEKMQMDVPAILQYPELPNGCEITSLTAVLRYYGYKVSKTQMADVYLLKRPFVVKNNKRYGADPYKAYAGNPRDNSGFFSYAPPIVEAANRYLKASGQDIRASDISGSTRDEIMDQIGQGMPVLVWITLGLNKPERQFSWYFEGSGEYFQAPVNLHAVVLNGFDNNKVFVMDPLRGEVSYEAGTFFHSYSASGSHAMIVGKPS